MERPSVPPFAVVRSPGRKRVLETHAWFCAVQVNPAVCGRRAPVRRPALVGDSTEEAGSQGPLSTTAPITSPQSSRDRLFPHGHSLRLPTRWILWPESRGEGLVVACDRVLEGQNLHSPSSAERCLSTTRVGSMTL